MKKTIMAITAAAMVLSNVSGVYAATANNLNKSIYCLNSVNLLQSKLNSLKNNCTVSNLYCLEDNTFKFNCNINSNCNDNNSGNTTTPEEKPENKPETKPEEKPDTTPETKPEEKPDTTPETKPEEKPDTTPEIKPEEKPDTTPDNNNGNTGNDTQKPDDNTTKPENGGGNSQGSVSLSAFEQEVLDLVNKERAAYGLSALQADSKVQAAAKTRANEILKSFSHTRPDGRAFSTALNEAGATYSGAGENIAKGQRTPEEVVNAWMNSAGHRANILNSKYKYLGVGCVKSGSSSYAWTQIFTY